MTVSTEFRSNFQMQFGCGIQRRRKFEQEGSEEGNIRQCTKNSICFIVFIGKASREKGLRNYLNVKDSVPFQIGTPCSHFFLELLPGE